MIFQSWLTQLIYPLIAKEFALKSYNVNITYTQIKSLILSIKGRANILSVELDSRLNNKYFFRVLLTRA